MATKKHTIKVRKIIKFLLNTILTIMLATKYNQKKEIGLMAEQADFTAKNLTQHNDE
jgi:hypothetical protein